MARSAGTSSGSVRSTRTTCSPKTIVVALVEPLSGFRMIGSVPHIAAAIATSATPGIAARRFTAFQRSRMEASQRLACSGLFVAEKIRDRLSPPDHARPAVADEHDGGPRDAVVRRAHRERV